MSQCGGIASLSIYYKNYRIALRVSLPTMRMMSLLDLAGKNLICNENSKQPLWSIKIYKSLNGLTPDYLKSMFTDRSAISTYSLRNCEGKLALPLPNTNFLKQRFKLYGEVPWNSLYPPICGKHKLLIASFQSGCRGFVFGNE